MRKNCSICNELIINDVDEQHKRTRYCSKECALIALKKHQRFYYNPHNRAYNNK